MGTLLNISILKTLRFNLHYFGFRGFQFPVLVSKNVVLKNLQGGVKIESYITANVRVGFDGTGICDTKYQRNIWNICGNVFIGENVKISAGTKLSCAEGATLHFGKNTSINVNSQIICMNDIHIGNNVMLSWDVLLMDSDFHQIRDEIGLKPISKPIVMGDDVWVGCRAIILKGCVIPKGCIIAANSTIARSYSEEHCLISTNGVIKREVRWKR